MNNDLISRSALKKAVTEQVTHTTVDGHLAKNKAIELIDNAPTVEERPQGEWLPQDNYNREYKCSVCGRIVEKDRFIKAEVQYPFCHCGADMRGEKNELQHN